MSIMQGDFVEVKLTRGLVAIIDAEDWEMVSQHMWCASRGRNTNYAVTGHGRKQVRLHRFLLNPPDGMHVDHINGDGLCNRRANLRLCTSSENKRNRRKQPGRSSEFKGVSKQQRERPKPWLAMIQVDKKRHARNFATEIEAALWYDEMAKELHGEFAKLNFP